MTNYKGFNPDLIVEVTSVCDRACVGCYAPNVIATGSPQEIYDSSPSLFLSPADLKHTLDQIATISSTASMPSHISLRGGEPTRHPLLSELIGLLSVESTSVYLETHGRWLLPQSVRAYKGLINSLIDNGTTVKLSFDSMHGLSKDDLKTITDILSVNAVKFLIAITESNDNTFELARSRCDWIPDSQIIVQPKATSASALVKPKMGVIGVDGRLKTSLNSKSSFAVPPSASEHERRIAL